MDSADRPHAGWRLSDEAAIDALVEARHGDPFAVLGPHATDAGTALRVLRPGAEEAEAIDPVGGKTIAKLLRRRADGFFEGRLSKKRDAAVPYRLRFTRQGATWEEDDAYRFGSGFGPLDLHLIAEGRHRRLYEKLGAHPDRRDGVDGVSFAVWAPGASRVSVVGDFNEWNPARHPMRNLREAGVWEIFVPGVERGAHYQYALLDGNGRGLPLKSDPVGFAHEHPPSTVSVVHGLPAWDWDDETWLAERPSRQDASAPISIYEVHLGSWQRADDGGTLGWADLAERLIPYVRDMGFTHIECLPVSEHPFTGSWGYQPIGLYAPTRRFGPPDGFAAFVDRCHREGIGVLIDWVPAHFPTDEHGLSRFDGTALYEHEDPRLGFHRDWNTLIYNFGRWEVANFLRANAQFWLDRYHVDGLRVDAVASMLYLDYSREGGDWVSNVHGGNENLEAIQFLKDLRNDLDEEGITAVTVAEESTAWPGVSRPLAEDGLGFDYKWNMGWMHDTLDYVSRDPIYRSHHQNEICFGLEYAFSENFVLPLSHDEVVHGKGSLLGRMPGDRWKKFANLRAYYGFMWTHPGKKLLFMGGEFAQEREWNHDTALDWHLMEDGMHAGVRDLVRDLNRFYVGEPALHELDCVAEGFEWIDASDREQSVFVYARWPKGREGRPVVTICHFADGVAEDYRIGVPFGGRWVETLNTDDARYGGSGAGNPVPLEAEDVAWHGQPASLRLTLPPLATMSFVPDLAEA